VTLLNKWWPPKVDRLCWAPRLSRFYAESLAYHAMTASGDKGAHPQVRALMDRISPSCVYAEIGCGGGLVSGMAAGKGSNIHAFDIAASAVENATRMYGGANVRFRVASADGVPLEDDSMDGAWSFEVLEHLWDPVAALREMVRIVKPGGFVFVTCPNHFSLDLHLRKSCVARLTDVACATLRYVQDRLGTPFFVNLEPHIDGDPVYPDCDMVSSLIPCRIPALARSLGCRIEALDMFLMRARQCDGNASQRMDSFSRVPLLRWFGDHVFLILRKPGLDECPAGIPSR